MNEINERIDKIALKYFEGNNSKFAKSIGTNEANIRNYRTKVIPKADFLIMLHNKLEISFDWVLLGIGDENKVNDSKLFDVELKKKDRQIARLQQEIVALKDNTIVGSAPPTLESNVNYKELAEARLETIDGLKFKIATLEKETDYDKSSQRGDLGGSKTPTGAMKKEEVHK
ncbi:hypothetical protein [Flavobacterium psychrophilum]|uniref:hypothetical protein n=1 Tax=Flavobacterium psychrophilum TaxID=96345 RepID=UPI000B7C550D|nr:hypothetical protein [Flavobacterium psychrophilum]MCB6232319.1 hypothetical protein [Flavobacterium psychrophilum]SNA72856.1 hypothetical protein FI146_200031 [Flavobacterium psychrophilum]SNA77593.1 hypothetical protein DK095_460161 [Flavobacterium psychrophilum]